MDNDSHTNTQMYILFPLTARWLLGHTILKSKLRYVDYVRSVE